MKNYISNITNSTRAIYKNLGNAPFIFVLVAIAIYFWINGQSHFLEWGNSQSNLIMVYIIMMMAFFVWSKKQTETQANISLSRSAFTFVFFFMISWVVFISLVGLGWLAPASDFNMALFWPMIILQICVVAPAEELIFRGVLLAYTGVLIQAILFAIWHSYAYNVFWYDLNLETFNWGALIFAFVMGIVLGLIAKNKKWGLPASIAVHASYNLVVMGAFTLF